MERDIRETPIFKEMEDLFQRVLGPGLGKVSVPGDPIPSPDGRLLAFRGERLDKLEGDSRGRICLAASDGSWWREISHGPNDDDQPRWSPDGRTLTFRSDREKEGTYRLYALATDEIGEARALPELPGVAELHAWSPDGSTVLVLVAGKMAEQSDAIGSGTVGGKDDAPSWVPEVLSSDLVADEGRRLFTIDVASGAVEPLTREDVNVWEAAWCGNDSVVAIASDGAGEAAWYRSRVIAIDRATGTDRVLLTTDVQLGGITASPNGRTVAVVEALCSDRLVVAGDLILLDPATGTPRWVEANGVDVSGLDWRDDETLLAFGIRGLDCVALDIDVTAAAAKERWVTSEAGGDFTTIAHALGDGFAVRLQSHTRPPEIVAVSNGDVRTVVSTAHEGTALVAEPLAERRRLSWSAPDGLEIQGLLTLPHGDAPHPLILLVHGGPVWAYQDLWPGIMMSTLLARGYAILQPNPRGSWGRGREFAGAVVGDMGGKDAQDILAGIDHVIELGLADPDRIAVTGGSYGGFMSCLLPCLDQRFKAAVAISPVTDWYSERFESNLGSWAVDFLRGDATVEQAHYHERSPVFRTGTNRTPTLLTAGRHDRATPTGQAVEFFRALREQDVPADVVLYPEEGHGVSNFPTLIDLTARVVGWFDRYLGAS